MSFDEWYDENKEVLTQVTLMTKLRRAYEAGAHAERGESCQIQEGLVPLEPECVEGRI
jgi:hypothetical protein